MGTYHSVLCNRDGYAMKKLVAASLFACALLPLGSAQADRDKREPDEGYVIADGREYTDNYKGKHKDQYRDGDCEVKRKWKKNGEYQEQRKCKPQKYVEPVVVPVYPVAPAGPGITINGTAVIRP
ncbi:hypothetical protein CAL26_02125 [Bordetella genomosp. 9]|uniref:Uncharacterized protein n=2 Tax=Bordetella genomosp. 9 TaxID=1416803 RepID=A0A261RMH8_9BORD|nr:hypothetical protein CAL26_02125 [Bordetella genomosp. 9]